MTQLGLLFPEPTIYVPPPARTQFNPRDYQQRGIDKAFELWAGGAIGCIFRQPTGSGKTVSGALIADRWIQQGDDYHCIILAHEIQLVGQFADEVEDVLGERPGIEMGSKYVVYPDSMPKIVVASRATLMEREIVGPFGDPETSSRLYKFDKRLNWLVILDECHRWAWKLKSCRHILQWFAENPKSKRLGLTATPERGDKTSLSRILPEVASDYRLYDIDGGACAVNDGWAVPYDQRFVTVEGVDFKNISQIAGDFDQHELSATLSEQKTLLSFLIPTLELVGNRRTIIFNPAKEKGQEGDGMHKKVALAINALRSDWKYDFPAPGAAVYLDGGFNDVYRKDVYARHQRGDFQFLSVCGLCREGYNDPGIAAVAIFRPTKSRSLAEQMKGRGCRTLRGLVDKLTTPEDRRNAIALSDKPNCMVVDLVGVTGMADCASTAHILASGKPDEVIKRANDNAQEKAKDNKAAPIDMAEEIRQAEREIREERERRELEEAKRKARIKADVHYNATRVEQGKGGSVKKKSKGPVMPFGKHRGQPIRELPQGYLEWLARDCKTNWIKKSAQNVIMHRATGERSGPRRSDFVLEEVNRLLMGT